MHGLKRGNAFDLDQKVQCCHLLNLGSSLSQQGFPPAGLLLCLNLLLVDGSLPPCQLLCQPGPRILQALCLLCNFPDFCLRDHSARVLPKYLLQRVATIMFSGLAAWPMIGALREHLPGCILAWPACTCSWMQEPCFQRPLRSLEQSGWLSWS